MKTWRHVLLVTILIPVCLLVTACSKKSPPSAFGLALTVSPLHPSMTKPITFQVHVTGPDGQAVNDAEVNGALTMKLMDMGATPLKFAPKGNGDYETSVKSLDMSGPWSLTVNARQSGRSAKQSFDVNIFD